MVVGVGTIPKTEIGPMPRLMHMYNYTYTKKYLGGLIIEDTNLTTFSHGTYTMMDSEIWGWAPSFPNMQPALFRITALH